MNLAHFETAIGRCAVLWTASGVCGVCLPKTDLTADTAWMRRHFPAAVLAGPPSTVANAILRIQGLLNGSQDSLKDIDLDLGRVGDFEHKVYDLTREILPGQTRTYGELANALGDIALSRAVGQALGANPCPIIVPCHRVLGAGGKSGGFSAPGGLETKARILTIEKARTSDAPMLFDDLPVEFRNG